MKGFKRLLEPGHEREVCYSHPGGWSVSGLRNLSFNSHKLGGFQMDFVGQFSRSATSRVPLIAVRTPDPASTIRALVGALNGDADTVPLLQWDVLTGANRHQPTGEACGSRSERRRKTAW